MKPCIICVLFLSLIGSCNAQGGNNSNLIRKIGQAIDTVSKNADIFGDTVYFEIKGKTLMTHHVNEIANNWEKIKVIFRGTDFVINEITLPNRAKAKIYEIKNHKSIFVIKVNEQGKISVIRELALKLPPNAPPGNNR